MLTLNSSINRENLMIRNYRVAEKITGNAGLCQIAQMKGGLHTCAGHVRKIQVLNVIKESNIHSNITDSSR